MNSKRLTNDLISISLLVAIGCGFSCVGEFKTECPEGTTKISINNGSDSTCLLNEQLPAGSAGAPGGTAGIGTGAGAAGAGGNSNDTGGAGGQMSGPLPGSFDMTFGQRGKVRVPLIFGGQTLSQLKVKSAKFQSSGKIVVAGMAGTLELNTPLQSFLARFNQDGTLDFDFGAGAGYVIFVDPQHRMSYGIDAIEIMADDKIVAVGYTDSPGNDDYATVLARFNADGTRDSSFLSDPVEPALVNYSIVRMNSGKLLVAGNYKAVADIYPPTHLYVFRFDEQGSFDVDFQGVEMAGDSGGLSGPGTVIVDSRGNFVIGMDHYGDFAAVARLGPAGSRDPSFGERKDGYHFENWGRGAVNGIDVHLDGSVILAGSIDQNVGGGTSAPQPTPALLRYIADGTRADSTFGNTGLVLGVPGGGKASQWNCVTALRDAKIVAVGDAFEYDGVDSNDNYSSNAARFLANGSPDLNFGPNATGSIVLNEGMAVDKCLVDELGRTVVVGHSRLNNTRALDIVRIWN